MLYLKIFIFIIGVSSLFFMDGAFKYFSSKKKESLPEKSLQHEVPSTLIAFYKSLENGNCSQAMILRPKYTLTRCKKISELTINEIKLKSLGENTATVFLDLKFKLASSNVNNKFSGTVQLNRKDKKWLITENFVDNSQSENSNLVDDNIEASPRSSDLKIKAISPESDTEIQTTFTSNDVSTKENNISPKIKSPMEILSDKNTSDFLFGRFEPPNNKGFSKIASRFSSRPGMYMNSDAYLSFKKMHQAAAQDGVDLIIKSAARNFNYQKGIWEGKWNGSRKVEGKDLSKSIPSKIKRALKILENSSMPGSSRHHWGTDIDLNAFTNNYFASGKGKKEYEWLRKNAKKYHFCQPYSSKIIESRLGYNEEKWHWSYMPLSRVYLEQSSKLMKNEMFTGFKGSEAAISVDIVGRYVFGISEDCY